ncbi:MAG: hypothetical protein GSR77_04315, partial [Desulfurococcales archaeon]|nr:hypothetical protein [Desulfurococcales archaeon]
MRFNFKKATMILILVLIIISAVFIETSRDRSLRNSNVVSGKQDTTIGVGILALQAIEYGENRHTPAIRERVNEIHSYCINNLHGINISKGYVYDFAGGVVERFVNVSTQAWIKGDMKTLAILQYVGWPLKQELQKIPYRPDFNTTQIYITACTLNETLNNLEVLQSLVQGSPRISKEDLTGLLDAWRNGIGYNKDYDIKEYIYQFRIKPQMELAELEEEVK